MIKMLKLITHIIITSVQQVHFRNGSVVIESNTNKIMVHDVLFCFIQNLSSGQSKYLAWTSEVDQICFVHEKAR